MPTRSDHAEKPIGLDRLLTTARLCLERRSLETENRELTSLEWRTSLAPDFLATEMVVEPDKLSMAELNTKINYMNIFNGAFYAKSCIQR